MEAKSFIDFNPHAASSLQKQLHQFIVFKIEEGHLPPGTKLPASRNLAKELSLSRNTITAVIEQLKIEGYLTSQTGSGVFVNTELPHEPRQFSKINWASKTKLPTLSKLGRHLNTPINNHSNNKPSWQHALPFTPGIPDTAVFPNQIWQKLNNKHAARNHLKSYDGPQGYLPLRESLATYLRISRGVICEPEQIVITHGAQQAINLCSLVLLNEYDEVLIENPGYANAVKTFHMRNAKVTAIAIGDDGLQVNKLPNTTDAKLMYTTPTHQYPLGGILPAADRIKLLDWATQHKVWILEDDYDSEFHFLSKPIAAIQGMAAQTPVIYLGSFSKTLFPALRIGYLVVPKPLVPVFVRAKAATSGETPLLNQAIIADFIAEGYFVRHLRKMRILYQKKWEHMQFLIEKHLQNDVIPIAKSAGMHITLETKTKHDQELAQAFQQLGFGSTPLSSYYFKGPRKFGLVLGFANTTTQERIRGIKALGKLLNLPT